MAKKSFVLSNDDGRVSFSNTSSVSIDDGITTGITGAISASQLYVTTLTASSLGTTNPTGSFLSASSTGILARSTLTGSFSSGALGWNGNAIVATNVIPGDYSGISAIDTDISGNYSDDIKVVGIGNVFSGSLPVAFGGTGLTGSQYAASSRLILKVSGSTAPVISTLSASASGTIIASGEGRFHVQPLSYQPDVRFYETPGTYTWTRPIGARFARIILIGAGGSGGGGANCATYPRGGGGGGSGGLTDITLDISSYTSASITVGAGGVSGSLPACLTLKTGQDGGSTIFNLNNSLIYTAGGGGGGYSGASTAVGAAGTGLTKNGSPGWAPDSATPPTTVYGISTGGGKGRGVNPPALPAAQPGLTFTSLTSGSKLNFGYENDTSGKLINIIAGAGASGSDVINFQPSKPIYPGAGGGGGYGSSTISQASLGGPGADGCALIISW